MNANGLPMVCNAMRGRETRTAAYQAVTRVCVLYVGAKREADIGQLRDSHDGMQCL